MGSSTPPCSRVKPQGLGQGRRALGQGLGVRCQTGEGAGHDAGAGQRRCPRANGRGPRPPRVPPIRATLVQGGSDPAHEMSALPTPARNSPISHHPHHGQSRTIRKAFSIILDHWDS